MTCARLELIGVDVEFHSVSNGGLVGKLSSLLHLPFGFEVGAGFGLVATPDDFLVHSPLLRLVELEERSRGTGLPDRDFDASMYFSRKWSSQVDVEPGIVMILF